MLVADKPNKNDRAANKADKQARILERRPLVKELEKIELNITQWNAEKKICDDRLNDSELYTASDKTELQDLLKKQADFASKLDTVEERWLELHEMLEAIPALD